MNKLLLGMVIALGLSLVALFFFRAEESVPTAEAYPDRAFAVENIEQVQHIKIADMNGRNLDLVQRGSEGAWFYDDSVKVSPSMIDLVLRVIQRVRVDHIPPKATVPMIVEGMRTSAIRVASFDEEGELLKSILIGPSSKGERMSYMMVEGQSQPYAVKVPGHGGVIRPIFDLRSKVVWRAKEYIAFEPANITSVEVHYPRNPGQSFRVSRTAERFALEPLSELVTPVAAEPSQRMLEAYLEGFAHVPAAKWEDDFEGRDSLRSIVPYAELRITDKRGAVTELVINPMYVLDEFLEPMFDEAIPAFLVERNGNSLARVQTMLMEQWFRRYQDFFTS